MSQDKLFSFLSQVTTESWESCEFVKSFEFEHGKISCIRLEGRFYMSSKDVSLLIQYMLNDIGFKVYQLEKYNSRLFSHLRNIKGDDAFMLDYDNTVTKALYRLGCIQSPKLQKIFEWASILKWINPFIYHLISYNQQLEQNLSLPILKRVERVVVQPEPVETINFDLGIYDFVSPDAMPVTTTKVVKQPVVDMRADVYTPEYRFKCQFCDKKYKRSEHVRRHEKIHLNIRDYSCTFCPKTFSRSDNLQCHLRVHMKHMEREKVNP